MAGVALGMALEGGEPQERVAFEGHTAQGNALAGRVTGETAHSFKEFLPASGIKGK